MDCSSWAMIAAQKWHFSSFLKTCFACFCCRCQGFLKVVQAWHVRDPLHQTGKYVNQEIELYFIVKLCLLEIRTKRWVMLGHVLHHSHSSFSQESTRKCCGGWLGRMPGFPACCFQFQHEVYGNVIWRCIILMKNMPYSEVWTVFAIGRTAWLSDQCLWIRWEPACSQWNIRFRLTYMTYNYDYRIMRDDTVKSKFIRLATEKYERQKWHGHLARIEKSGLGDEEEGQWRHVELCRIAD